MSGGGEWKPGRFMRLATGRLFDPWAVEFAVETAAQAAEGRQKLRLMDLAQPLAMIPRFGGHSKALRSVAAHSLDVAELVRLRGGSATTQLCALMHDAHEAFFGDVPSPWKWRLGDEFRFACERLQAAIEFDLGCGEFSKAQRLEVARADEDMLHLEGAHLLLGGIDGLKPAEVVAMRGPEVAIALRLRQRLVEQGEEVAEFMARFHQLREFASYEWAADQR